MATRKKAVRKKAGKPLPRARGSGARDAGKVSTTESAASEGNAKGSGSKRRQDGSKAKITRLMRKFEKDAKEKENFHMSVSDYLRLLQMKRELDDQPGNVEVRWVETPDEVQSDET
jgi:hypothetical protein